MKSVAQCRYDHAMTFVRQTYQQQLADGALRPDPKQDQAVAQFERLETELMAPRRKAGLFRKAPSPIRGLYLYGGVGRGKSMLMDMFVESLNVPARRVHFHAFMQEVHAKLHAARKNGHQDALIPVVEELSRGLRLLALDEMQITDITDAMIVGRFFEALMARDVVVVTTSNRHPTELYKNGLNRQLFLPFIDIIQEQLVVYCLDSDRDYRQDRLMGAQTYFTPLGPQSHAAMDAVWHQLVNGEAVQSLDLVVTGRTITLPQFSNGVARASFHDLCGAALGPGDYLEIARAARVLFIDNIPTLGRGNFNMAKRFVTLIDALYEARVQVIASAAAAPDFLYLEGEGAFEFERTASRLMEMQSAEWASAL